MRFLVTAIAVSLACSNAATESAVPTAANQQIVAALRQSIDDRYSHRDRLNLDWPTLFQEASPALERAANRDALVGGLIRLLANAQDEHLVVTVDKRPIPTFSVAITPNYDRDQITREVADLHRPGKCLAIGRVGNFGYAWIESLHITDCASLPTDWAAAYPTLQATSGLILDLRGNSGGNDAYAAVIAGHFTPRRLPYAKIEVRDRTQPTGFSSRVRYVEPAMGAAPYPHPVVVLTGPRNMSSAESFLLMMRAVGATLIGGRSRGSSGNPEAIDLGQGITVLLPRWRLLAADGTPIEGIGIAPDIEIPTTPAEIASIDKILDAAVAELTKRTNRTNRTNRPTPN